MFIHIYVHFFFNLSTRTGDVCVCVYMCMYWQLYMYSCACSLSSNPIDLCTVITCECSQTYEGKTALMWASSGGHAETVRVLVELGASVEAVDKVNIHGSINTHTHTHTVIATYSTHTHTHTHTVLATYNFIYVHMYSFACFLSSNPIDLYTVMTCECWHVVRQDSVAVGEQARARGDNAGACWARRVGRGCRRGKHTRLY